MGYKSATSNKEAQQYIRNKCLFRVGGFSVELEGSLKNFQSLNWRVKYLLPFRKVEKLYKQGKASLLK